MEQKERANFVPESSLDQEYLYTDTFNFGKMFPNVEERRWKTSDEK